MASTNFLELKRKGVRGIHTLSQLKRERTPMALAISPVLAKTSNCALFIMLRFIHLCIITALLSISSTSPIKDYFQSRHPLMGNTGQLELEGSFSAIATAATPTLQEQAQQYGSASLFRSEVSNLGVTLTDLLWTAKCIRGKQSNLIPKGTFGPSSRASFTLFQSQMPYK